jgi:hypothetical protein
VGAAAAIRGADVARSGDSCEGNRIYRQSNGMLLLNVQKAGNGNAATFDIGIQS